MSRSVIAFSVCCLAVLGFVSGTGASTFAGIGVTQSPSGVVVPVDFKCRKVDGKIVCGSTKGNKNKNRDDDDDDAKPKKSEDKVIPKTCGKKVNCEAGLVKLEKPNKYGACCEAREGLPPPKQQEAEKCKFPGEVGTPPNCSCPAGTEFMGYKGCLPKAAKKPAFYCSEVVPASMEALARQTCTNNHPGAWLNCSIPSVGNIKCCCNWLE